MNQNPYAAFDESDSRHRPASSPSGLRDADTKHLFVVSPAVLPERCVLTNQTDDLVQVAKPMYYVSPLVWLGFLVCGLPGMLVLYFVLRKRVDLTYYVNRSVLSSRKTRSGLGWLSVLGAIGLMIFAGLQELPLAFVPGILLLLGGLIVASKYSNILIPNKHQEGEFRLRGAGSDFLRDTITDMDRFRPGDEAY